jgi:hypothetical protein
MSESFPNEIQDADFESVGPAPEIEAPQAEQINIPNVDEDTPAPLIFDETPAPLENVELPKDNILNVVGSSSQRPDPLGQMFPKKEKP